ncbi:hypothetical protein [Dactylosporangium fulvum]|uniref:Uncharacterized protein n=1 Tax=Dactylosporangium fulvum TaxID=53359 RepID=A0ABY5VNQ3_9ACTN|nr:hypothetical protein [Dactylosporangium fulvum]UWP78709.1 hypothetical protein Dfulv_26430 [Dactylosporangium fulvum]
MSDAESDPAVRAGRPTTVDAATVVDPGIWIDGRALSKAAGPTVF